MNIPINQKAPAVASRSVQIDRPVQRVWDVLTSIDRWPLWQKHVCEAKLHGRVARGTEFSWKAAGINFKSKIHTCKEYLEFGWTGKTIGANAVHNWTFKEENGKTTVTVEESLQGILPRLLRSSFRKSLGQGIDNSLVELKNACESKDEAER